MKLYIILCQRRDFSGVPEWRADHVFESLEEAEAYMAREMHSYPKLHFAIVRGSVQSYRETPEEIEARLGAFK